MTSLEIKDKRSANKTKLKELLALVKTEKRELTETEQAEFDALKAENETLATKLAELEEKLLQYEEETEENEKEEKSKTRSMKKDKKVEFRLLNAINKIANNKPLSDTEQAYIEEGQKSFRDAGTSYSGQIVLPSESRAIVSGKDATSVEIASILEPLRAKNVLFNAGANFMTGLRGDVQVPLMNGANVSWATENGEATDAGTSFTNVKLSPRRLTAFLDISKQFLAQSSEDAEAKIRMDIVNAINTKLEATILGSAAGTATQPAGLFSLTGISSLTISNYLQLATLNSYVDDANVLNERNYIVSNSAKAWLRTTAKGSVGGGYIMESGEVDGEKVHNSSNVVANKLIYGDFSNLIIGEWSGIDLTVDMYTQATKGAVRLVINAYFDAQVATERLKAFAIGTVVPPTADGLDWQETANKRK